jgi:hypothetical protein
MTPRYHAAIHQSDGSADGSVVSPYPHETYSRNHPGLLFSTPELRTERIAHGGLDPLTASYVNARNDLRLGIQPGPQPKRESGFYLIDHRESVSESNGRSRVYGRFLRRSLRVGRMDR